MVRTRRGAAVEAQKETLKDTINGETKKTADKPKKAAAEAKTLKEQLKNEPKKAAEKPVTPSKEVEEVPVKSFAFLLQQGIQSNDLDKVDKAIKACAKDRRSAFETAKELDVAKVVPLLQMMNKVFREGQQKRKSAIYLRDLKYWIDFLEVTLQAHATFLSTVSNLDQQIGGLLEYVQARTAQLDKLMKLEGKISFMTEQVHRRLNPIKCVEQAPLVVFEDDFSDEDVDPLKDNEAEMNADSEEEADWFHGAEPEDADLEDELMEED